MVLRNMMDSRNTFQGNKEFEQVPGASLLKVLCMWKACALSDHRDMIYAHLVLSSAQARNAIPIDYDKTVTQLYEDQGSHCAHLCRKARSQER